MELSDENLTHPSVPPEWCFDMEIWLHSSSEPNVSRQLRYKYGHYKMFSYRYNGLLTLLLIIFGIVGSVLLLRQIYTSRIFSKRLAVHLGLICIWDVLYLLSCLSTYCLPSLIYQVTPIYGPFAYILFFLQPFASFCVSCTIWQVFAITLERYLAVSSPLEQRTRKAKFGVGWICLAIITGAFILNILPVPFENELVECYEIDADKFGNVIYRNYTMMKPYFDDRIRLYRFVVHFFPDLIFRAPLPIIIIGALTVRTIQACNHRTVGNFQIGVRLNRNMPLRLSLLNLKFVLCNTLYMFNTILLELLEYGNLDYGDYDGYINSFYLTDASNMLLVVHSATNWLLFYNIATCRKKDAISITFSTSLKYSSFKFRVAEYMSKVLNPIAPGLGVDIMQKICDEIPEIDNYVNGNAENEKEKHDKVILTGLEIGHFIGHVLKWFSDRSKRTSRKLFIKRYTDTAFRAKLNFKPSHWKHIRSIFVDQIVKQVICSSKEMKHGCPYSSAEIEECATRIFNHVLSEMRSGVLCANVEEKQKISRCERYVRSNSTSNSPTSMVREIPRKSQSISMRFQYSTSVDSVLINEQHQLLHQL